MQISIGNCGAITSVMIYRPTPTYFARHNYRIPHIITLGYVVGAIGVTAALWFFLNRANKRRDALAGDAEKTSLAKQTFETVPLEERLSLGDRHPAYRYQV
jgi:hypothetical protein